MRSRRPHPEANFHHLPGLLVPSARPQGPHARPPELTALTSIRLFAALHIFLFHMYDFQSFNKGLQVFDAMPSWAIDFIRHGYCSTGLFFLLSGFVLTYVYVDGSGRLKISKREFWIARLARIYPLHLATLVLFFLPTLLLLFGLFGDPAPPGAPVPSWLFIAIGGVLGIFLLQAWFPIYVTTWNPPTWVLSTVVFFYAVFPWLVQRFARLNRARQAALLAALPVVSLAPSVVYLLAGGDELPMSFWHEFLLRTPLFWLPHFVMGMLLARAGGGTRYGQESGGAERRWAVAWGDAAGITLLLLLGLPDATIARLLFLPDGVSPRLFVRHGALAPLYLVLILDLARNRGILARLLSLERLKALGEASYSIFILQLPVLILSGMLLGAAPVPAAARLAALVSMVVAVSVASTRFFERPVSRWLRRKLAATG